MTTVEQMRNQQQRQQLHHQKQHKHRHRRRLSTMTRAKRKRRLPTPTRRRAVTRTPHPSSGAGTDTRRALSPHTADTHCRDTAAHTCVRRRMTVSDRRFFRKWAAGQCTRGAGQRRRTRTIPTRRQIFSSARTRTPARRAAAPDFSCRADHRAQYLRTLALRRSTLRPRRRRNLAPPPARRARTAHTRRRDTAACTGGRRTSDFYRRFSRTQSGACRRRCAVCPSRTGAADQARWSDSENNRQYK